MDLKEFITQTLTQISEGVAVARSNTCLRVAPQLNIAPKDHERIFLTVDNLPAFLVQFDVAVTVAEKSAAGGGGGIQVMSFISAKGEKTHATESSSVSRVQFEVPIRFGD